MPLPVAARPVDANDTVEIQQLITEHAWVLDRGDVTTLADLYTEDGILVGLDKPLVGRAELAEWSRWRAGLTHRTSRHVHTNIRLSQAEPDVVTGSLVTLLYRYEGEGVGPTTPMLVLDYDDEYRRVAGRWLIKSRTMVRVFVDAERLGAKT